MCYDLVCVWGEGGVLLGGFKSDLVVRIGVSGLIAKLPSRMHT